MVRWNHKLYVEVPTEKKSNLISTLETLQATLLHQSQAVCDLTAMGWVIILYDCLIQAHIS